MKSLADSRQPHDDNDHDQDERRPCYCYGSGVVVLAIEEDSQEHEFVVPCRRCSDSR
jgi:hypothetical protein